MTNGIEEFEVAFRRDPADADAFAALRGSYQADSRWIELAALFERRAAHLKDNQKAADLYYQAAELYGQLEERDGEMRVLSRGVHSCRQHKRSLERLKALLLEEQRWVELLELLDLEIDGMIESTAENPRLARLLHDAGAIWENEFHRLDRAIQYYQRAFKADPSHTESIEAGRRIYAAMGHWKTVAALHEVELSTCSDARRRVELLLARGHLQWEKLGDLEGAARSFSEASQLRPGDEAILESLGEVHASPEWPTPGGLQHAGAIFLQVAQRRQTNGDRDGAISYLRRALGSDPENKAAFSKLEQAYEDTGRWEDLDRLYRQRLSVASEEESLPLLARRGELLERKLGDQKGARECYEALQTREPQGGPATTRLIEICRAEGDWEKVVELLRRALDQTQDRVLRIRLIMDVAFIERDHLGDPETAAHLFHQVLQLDPEQRKALTAYEDYFRQKGDYRNLAELLRFAAQAAADAGSPAMEVCARLEELADISERRLGDLEGALEAWQRIAQLHPDVQRSDEATSRLAAKLRMWQGMVNVLDREIRAASHPSQRLQALRRAVQVFFEKNADPLRTIEYLKEILGHSPQDEEALRMLVHLYERESDYPGLAWALEHQLRGIMSKTERIPALRRLAEIYADKLDQPREALSSLKALLDLSPNDTKVQDRIQSLLQKIDDLEQLVRILEYRSQVSRSLGDRLVALKALAHIMDDRLDDPGRSAAYWEEVRTLDSEDQEALEALTRIYDRTRRNHDLTDILEQRLQLATSGRSEGAVSTVQAGLLRQLALVAEQRLSQVDEAVRAYEQLATLLPADRDTLEALARLYARQERWMDLVRVFGRQIELSEDQEHRVALAFKQADLLEEKLHDLTGAALIFEHIIANFAPGDLDAHHRLKDLYLRLGEHQRATDVAERELFLVSADKVEDRLTLALEIAELWRDKVKNEHHAVLAFERVLELDPENVTALAALRRLCHRIGSYRKLVKLAPTLFATLESEQERRVLLLEVAEIFEEKLRDPEAAFEWYRRAFDLFPADGRSLAHLQRMAQEHGLWEDLISAYLEARRRTEDPAQFLLLTQEVARICKDELRDPARAFQVLHRALTVDTTGEAVLPELEALALASGQERELLGIFDEVIARLEEIGLKQRLLRRRAQLAEHNLSDPALALSDTIRLFALIPADEELAQEIERLASLAGRWELAIQVHGQRFLAAPDPSRQLFIAKHVALLVEDRLGDLARAFRIYLRAFAIDPTDEPVTRRLWQLADTLHSATSSTVAAESAPGERAAGESEEGETLELRESEVELIEDLLVIESTRRPRRDSTIDDPSIIEILPGGPPPPPPPAALDASPLAATDPFAPGPPVVTPWAELAAAHLALPALTPDARIQHLLAVARIWSEGAGDVERALDVLAEAAAIDIEHREVRDRLEDLAARHDRFDRLLQIHLDALERASDARTLIELRLKVAEMLLAHQRVEEAEYHLGAVLVLQPENQTAADHLYQIYRAAQRWQDLAFLQERQLEALTEVISVEERRSRLLELADLCQHTIGRPFEAADFLVRLAAVDEDNLEIRLRLADLYEELSIWPKLIELIQSMLKIVDEPQARANLLLRIARVFDEELELPDRAIEAYQLVLVEDALNPWALEALEKLFERHHRHLDLIEVLRLRVELAESDPAAARAFLIRLARALEALSNFDEALECLQRARPLGPLDPDIEESLARIYVLCGRPEEATALLRDQIAVAQAEGHPNEEITALLVRLARIQDQQLRDEALARQTLEEAIHIDPRHPEVLHALAQHFARKQEWNDFIEVQLRIAEVVEESDEVIPILMNAAKILEEQLRDTNRAIELYENVLGHNPAHLPAIDALLAVTGDDPDRQEQLLKLKLDLVADAQEEAAVITQLGTLLRQRGAPADAVAALFRKALELDECLVPAIDALSSLYLEHDQLEPARALLLQAAERLARTAEIGPLYYRLGQIFEKMGRREEGYAYLLEALRLDPGNFLLRIAVGMNRFHEEQWREALRHLTEVIDSPQRPDHPDLAAEALHAAGACETALRRADRALPLYRAALELNPRHVPSRRALAAAAQEAEDWTVAAQELEHLRPLLDQEDHQRALLKTLGDLYLQHLLDVEAAARCFEALLQLLPADEASRLETLPHLLPVFRQAERHHAAAQAAEDLAGLLASAAEQRDMLLLAAREWDLADSPAAADVLRRQILRQEPGCFEAVLGLSQSLEREARFPEMIALLLGFLSSQPPTEATNQEGMERLAHILFDLGRAQQRTGEDQTAISSLEQSLRLKEDIAVRETLAGIYEQDPAHLSSALANHCRLIEHDVGRVDSLRILARYCASTADARERFRAYSFYQALQVLGQLDPDDEAFLASYRPPLLDAETFFPGEILEEDRLALLSLPQTNNLSEVFSLLWEAAPTILDRDISQFGVTPTDRVSPMANSNLAKVFGACAKALGVKQTTLYARSPDETATVQVVGMAPPAIIAPRDLDSGRPVSELRFLIGRALELTHPAHIFAAGLERAEFARLLSSVLRAFHPRHMRGRRDLSAEAMEQAAALRRALPFKAARRLGEIFREQQRTQFDSAQWRLATLMGANRAGLALCGDLAIALEVLRREDPALGTAPVSELLHSSPAVRDLLTFAVSDAYLMARGKLGLVEAA